MKPVSPVLLGAKLPETTFAKHQSQYNDLPALRFDDREGTVLTRWKMTWRERFRALFVGDMYLKILTFGSPLQPVLLQVKQPELTTQQQ